MNVYRSAYALARVLIGGMFIYTGIIHGIDPEGFAKAIQAYRILPVETVNIFALILPGVELLAGLAIAMGIWIRGGALAVTGMLAVFALALGISLYRGLDISCGCFSTSPEAGKISWSFLVRDIALLITTSFILQHPWLERGAQRAGTSSRLGPLLVPTLTAVAVGGIFLFQALTRDPCQGVSLEEISRQRAFPSATILAKRPVAGLCEVLLLTGSQVTPLYVGDNFVIGGELYQERKNLTGEGFARLTSQYFLAMRGEADQAVAFTYQPKPPIKHTLYMFSSTTCPHCEKVLSQIKPILDETHTELKVLFMGQGQARQLAIEAFCRGVDLDTYLSKRWVTGGKGAACSQGEARVARSIELARRLGIASAPTFLTEDGTMLVGEQLPTLRKMLGSSRP